MNEQTILITGATDGIGRATALELARRGCQIVLHGRSPRRLEDALNQVRATGSTHGHLTVCADLASLSSVMELSDLVRQNLDRLDVLINNAGVYMNDRALSEDGFETTFAVNHLAHFLLTSELLGLLRASAPSRIVNVSSVAHRRGRIDFDDISASGSYSPYQAYAQSKLANLLFTRSLHNRPDTAVTANALHPGVVSTKLLKAGFNMSGSDPKDGAATSVYVATAPELRGVSGRYFVASAEKQAEGPARDDESAEMLWRLSVEMIRTVLPAWEPAL